jgi:CBS domain containing-hemolysin-like protein
MITEIVLPIAIITVLVMLNGVFVAAEFAIIGASRAAIERRAAAGHRIARTLSRILQDPRQQDRYIATAQLGITFASLGLGMYGEQVLAHWLAEPLAALGTSSWIAAHTLASVLAVAILTYVHIVIGEMVPKSLALMHAERTVLGISPLMLAVKAMLLPLVVALNELGNLILRAAGIRRAASGSAPTSEDLKFIIEESQQGGMLSAEQGEVLRELFAFGDRTAGELMVPRVLVRGLRLGASPEDLRAALRDAPHTRFPVYEGDLDHIAGIIHIKDVLRLVRAGTSLARHHLRQAVYVPETTALDRVLGLMRSARTQMTIVMDEHGGTAGVLTMEDLFAEIVGEVEEGAEGAADVRKLPDGQILAAGAARLDEVGESLGVALDASDVDTVSGLVLAVLDRPPAVGDAIVHQGVRFEVTSVEGHRVKDCRVARLPR